MSDASTADLETPLLSQSLDIAFDEYEKPFKISIQRFMSERLKNTSPPVEK
jgi:hypothetical protein